jgi:hypothetical protein
MDRVRIVEEHTFLARMFTRLQTIFTLPSNHDQILGLVIRVTRQDVPVLDGHCRLHRRHTPEELFQGPHPLAKASPGALELAHRPPR